jgi:hypothetical protein
MHGENNVVKPTFLCLRFLILVSKTALIFMHPFFTTKYNNMYEICIVIFQYSFLVLLSVRELYGHVQKEIHVFVICKSLETMKSTCKKSRLSGLRTYGGQQTPLRGRGKCFTNRHGVVL